MTQLLTEYFEIPIDEQLINEAKDGKALIISAVLQRANGLNQNERIYPLEVLQREAKEYESLIGENRALGELDHPDSTIVNLQNVSHAIKEQYWDGDTLKGKLEVLNTPAGNIARNLIAAGIKLGISSRGVGSVEENDGTNVVQDDYNLIAYDIVSNPSTPGAFLGESLDVVNKKMTKIKHLNNLMNEILINKI